MILQLLGVRLVRDKGPWSPRLEVIPLEQLGRPRIDVVVTICGFFRDMFPNLVKLLGEAVRLVAQLDEPPEVNYVKKHYLKLREALRGGGGLGEGLRPQARDLRDQAAGVH
jgi:cobaltochelatase CobN